MNDLFGNTIKINTNFTIFQDEAGCKDSNFFYHGFLLVDNYYGCDILDKIIEAKTDKSKDSDITFKEVRKNDYRVPIVKKWLSLADEWLRSGKIRFYVLGIDKKNLKNFWDNSWSFEKNLYLRFFEIGINSAVGWFRNDSKLNSLLKITHVYYEYGNYNDERKNKIRWLKSLSGYSRAEPVYSNPRRQKDVNKKLYKMSQLIQFTDILLGVTKYSFIELNKNYTGRKQCVDQFIEVIERFNNQKSAYRANSSYYKRYALQFFPTATDLTKEEFLSNNIENIQKRGRFYCDRLTYRQKTIQQSQFKLF
jgi:hypothetical protein